MKGLFEGKILVIDTVSQSILNMKFDVNLVKLVLEF